MHKIIFTIVITMAIGVVNAILIINTGK